MRGASAELAELAGTFAGIVALWDMDIAQCVCTVSGEERGERAWKVERVLSSFHVLSRAFPNRSLLSGPQ